MSGFVKKRGIKRTKNKLGFQKVAIFVMFISYEMISDLRGVILMACFPLRRSDWSMPKLMPG